MQIPTAAKTITAEAFFEVADAVLTTLGRGRLTEPYRSVIIVQPEDRVLQILAGPGSGKTEALVWRVLYEVFALGTEPSRLLVTTFTKRAATELQVRAVERSDAFLGAAHERGYAAPDPHVYDLRIGTVHSLCDSLLAELDDAYAEAGTELVDEPETAVRLARNYRPKLGFNDPPKPARLVNRLLAKPELVSLFRPPWEEPTRWPGRVMEVVSFLSDVMAQHVETWIPRCAGEGKRNGIEATHAVEGLTEDLCKLQARWEEYLDANNILDFATIQKRFLERQDTVLGHLDHVFVDEFQDNNPIQFAIHTKWLDNAGTRLTVVGDDDQAIYRFRGSDINCFRGLKPFCTSKEIGYRRETLGVNHRSTRRIVSFAEAFKNHTVLKQLSMPKVISPAESADDGAEVRLLTGPWDHLCLAVADELGSLGAGRHGSGASEVPTAAILMFSTSERQSRQWTSAALSLRQAIEARGMRVYNPRSKTANSTGSPVSTLLGIISNLIDPVSKAPVGKNGRWVEVWASNPTPAKASAARTEAPGFPINQRHATLQKAFLKADGGEIGAPAQSRADIIAFSESVRRDLAGLKQGDRGRLTLAGFVARVLAFPLFRNSGFTVSLFRQALFTQLLEANIAPTRLTLESLDKPLEVRTSGKRFVWPPRYWKLLSIFGGYLETNALDDLEVEAFQEDAILMITFHQAKGLEFDHVYVAGMGREPFFVPALRTKLFSGQPTTYTVQAGEVRTKDPETLEHALADREREVYVALTRARKSLTLLQDPANGQLFMNTHPAVKELFSGGKAAKHPSSATVDVRGASHVRRN